MQDLLRECNIANLKELRRLVKRQGLGPLRGGNDAMVPWQQAAAIKERLTGQGLDEYAYRQLARDEETGGPLEWANNPGALEHVRQWAYQLGPTHDIDLSRNQIVGVAFLGGYLRGAQAGQPCVLRLTPNVNVLIGERGAGKSTMMSLLGSLSASTSERAEELVESIIRTVNAQYESIPHFSRRVWDHLRKYDIAQYALYFVKDGILRCFYTEAATHSFSIFAYTNHSWTFDLEEDAWKPPVTKLLQQGEVIRISEVESQFYLAHILDSLDPDLHARRRSFAEQINKAIAQYQHTQPTLETESPSDKELITNFLNARWLELEQLRAALRDRQFNDIEDLVNRYIETLRRNRLNPIDGDWRDDDEFEQEDDGIDLDEEYRHYIAEFDLPEFEPAPPLADDEPDDDDDAVEAPDTQRAGRSEGSGESEQAPSAAPSSTTAGSPTPTSDDEPCIRELFLDVSHDNLWWLYLRGSWEFLGDAVEDIGRALRKGRIRRRTYLRAQQIEAHLRRCLFRLQGLARIYNVDRYPLHKPLLGLLRTYATLLDERMVLLNAQVAKCADVTQRVNSPELQIRVFCPQAQSVLAAHQNNIERIARIEETWATIKTAPRRQNFAILKDHALQYDEITKHCLTKFAELSDASRPRPASRSAPKSSDYDKFLFAPVLAELRQGSVFRPFNQLSFGQRSAIILKLVIECGQHDILIIDQPEDNLDAFSIVKALAPTFEELGKTRQVIVATHNSNLVMGMPNCRLIVMESQGEHGKVRAVGRMNQRELVSAMLEVLEGGAEVFNLKIKTYDEFVHRVRGEIGDIGIAEIESSFRRRTIDELRSLLQPTVSEADMLRIYRHELKQKHLRGNDVRELTRNIQQTLAQTACDTDALLIDINKLLEDLDSHISYNLDAISRLRQMNTKPEKTPVHLASFFDELRKQRMQKIRRTRALRIVVDAAFQDRWVQVDPGHLELVFNNLLENALRATMRQAFGSAKVVEEVAVELVKEAPSGRVQILFSDNGIGIPPDLRAKIYHERCTDQGDEIHGLGGVIISKLLSLNDGSIVVRSSEEGRGTVQLVDIPSHAGVA